MSKNQGKRDLEEELWEVYQSVADVDDQLARAGIQLKALELVVKIRSAGEKVKPGEVSAVADTALAKARVRANGTAS